MISVTSILVIGIAIALLYFFFKRDKRMNKYPPGPIGLPVIGNVLQMGNFPHLAFKKWSDQYGKAFSVRFAWDRAIVLNDVKMIRDMFNDPVFSGRPQKAVFNRIVGGNYGILNSEGHVWEEQRRYTLRHLRDFGFGKNAMELLINEEVREVLEWMKSEEGHPISVKRKFSVAVLNSLWTVVSGKRFEQNDTSLNDLLTSTTDAFNEVFGKGVAFFAPNVAKLLPELSGYNKLDWAINELITFIAKEIKLHKQNSNPDSDTASDFMQGYTAEIKKTTDPKSTFYDEMGEKNLKAVVSDLFNAGAETTSITLTWTLLFLLREEDVQQKFHKEIDDVIGKSRTPSLQDRPKMPYTEALINEVLRHSSIVPFGIFHTALVDTEYNGYFFPKGTWVMPNLHAIHHDKTIWGDPENFRPERFLDNNGKLISKPDAFLPFVSGKRACLGETLARDSLFLFLTGIFQRFQVLPDPANSKTSLEPCQGFLLTPKPYTLVMKDRIDF